MFFCMRPGLEPTIYQKTSLELKNRTFIAEFKLPWLIYNVTTEIYKLKLIQKACKTSPGTCIAVNPESVMRLGQIWFPDPPGPKKYNCFGGLGVDISLSCSPWGSLVSPLFSKEATISSPWSPMGPHGAPCAPQGPKKNNFFFLGWAGW